MNDAAESIDRLQKKRIENQCPAGEYRVKAFHQHAHTHENKEDDQQIENDVNDRQRHR